MANETISEKLPAGIKYHQVQQKSSHNSYSHVEQSIKDQVLGSNVHSLEVDLHKGRGDDLENDWYIYHRRPFDMVTNIETFSLFIALCRIIHDEDPNHDVITVFLDMQDDFTSVSNHTADQLDKIINDSLPGKVYTPAMMSKGFGTLIEAAMNENWETIDNLRGKFIFALTNSSITEKKSTLNDYVANGNDALKRTAFIAPDIDNADQIGALHYVVFNNFSSDKTNLGTEVFNNHLVSRVFEVENHFQWDTARSNMIHHIAIDHINRKSFPQFVLEDGSGRPFQSMLPAQPGQPSLTPPPSPSPRVTAP